MAQGVLRAAEVANLLGYQTCNPVYVLVRDGRLPAVRIGRAIRFRREDIEEFLRAGGDPHPLPRCRSEERGSRAPNTGERAAQT